MRAVNLLVVEQSENFLLRNIYCAQFFRYPLS